MKNIILMKYGVHADESVDSIMSRKQNEIHTTGRMFWGYGGSVCHPSKQVQPFAEQNAAHGEKTYLLLELTSSDNHDEPIPAVRFSTDKENWTSFGPNVNVVGSKHALICNSLEPCDITIDLKDYIVPIGGSQGRSLSEYYKGRTDKACGRRIEGDSDAQSRPIHISWCAELTEPYAVFVAP